MNELEFLNLANVIHYQDWSGLVNFCQGESDALILHHV